MAYRPLSWSFTDAVGLLHARHHVGQRTKCDGATVLSSQRLKSLDSITICCSLRQKASWSHGCQWQRNAISARCLDCMWEAEPIRIGRKENNGCLRGSTCWSGMRLLLTTAPRRPACTNKPQNGMEPQCPSRPSTEDVSGSLLCAKTYPCPTGNTIQPLGWTPTAHLVLKRMVTYSVHPLTACLMIVTYQHQLASAIRRKIGTARFSYLPHPRGLSTMLSHQVNRNVSNRFSRTK